MLGLLAEALHCHFHFGPALVWRNLNALDVSVEAGELKCPAQCDYTLLCFGLISRQAQSKPVNERRNSSAYFIHLWKNRALYSTETRCFHLGMCFVLLSQCRATALACHSGSSRTLQLPEPLFQSNTLIRSMHPKCAKTSLQQINRPTTTTTMHISNRFC